MDRASFILVLPGVDLNKVYMNKVFRRPLIQIALGTKACEA